MIQPFAYYGGKQRLLKELLQLIPPHTQYLEIFAGGSTLYWNKPPSKNEVLNDKNGFITNFYTVVKTKFHELKNILDGTLHSEVTYLKTRELLKTNTGTDVEKAWAFWFQVNCTFSHLQMGGFAFGTTGMASQTKNRIDTFIFEYAERLRGTEIFCRDAIELLELKSHEENFIYADPPYVSSNMGHYGDYTKEDFTKLLDALVKTKGKFLLSSYPEEILMEYRQKYGWNSKDIKQIVSVNGKRETPKYKLECLTWNYEKPSRQHTIFDDAMFENEAEVQSVEDGNTAFVSQPELMEAPDPDTFILTPQTE